MITYGGKFKTSKNEKYRIKTSKNIGQNPKEIKGKTSKNEEYRIKVTCILRTYYVNSNIK